MSAPQEPSNSEGIKSEPSSESLSFSQQGRLGRTKTRSVLMVAATGLGKTVMMGGLAHRWPKGRVMMLSHRFELNAQALKTFEFMCQEPVDLEQAAARADMYGNEHRIVVASVQTLNARRRKGRRMDKFRPEDFGLIMIDEAHHAAAKTYRRVIDYFMDGNPDCFLVGVTATPDRGDGVAMGHIFDEVACDLNIGWAVSEGWLVEPHQKFVQINDMDLSDIKTKRGDLDQKELAEIVEEEAILHQMAKPILDVTERGKKQAIVFTTSVQQAKRLSEMLQDYYYHEVGVDYPELTVKLDGSLSPQSDERKEIVRRFKNGNIRILCNCGVATEGFDVPTVEVIAIGRPTKVRSLYTQMVGRGTRALPGVIDFADSTPDSRKQAIAASAKPHCTVLDFVGQSGRHKLVCTADILGGDDLPDDVADLANRILSDGEWDASTLDAIDEARKMLQEEERKEIAAAVEVDYQLRAAGVRYDLGKIPQRFVPGYLKHKEPSFKQKNMLVRLGYTLDQIATMNPRSASAAIDHAIWNPKTEFGEWLRGVKRAQGEREARDL